jgi:hypothetical protein
MSANKRKHEEKEYYQTKLCRTKTSNTPGKSLFLQKH